MKWIVLLLLLASCTEETIIPDDDLITNDTIIIGDDPIRHDMAAHYIATTGSNGNDGSVGSPWLTIAYACANTSSGDIIYVEDGTYNISSQVSVPAGVSIEALGSAAYFVCSVTSANLWTSTGFALLLSGGSDAGQHISGIYFDGDSYTGYGAIAVWGRNNVTINDNFFDNFSHWGVRFNGNGSYITGCVFNGNEVNDCAGYVDGSLGCLGIEYIGGMLIHNNTIVQPANRGVDNEGEPIFGVEGYLKNVKIYDNTITKVLITSGRWDFAIECWNWQDGNEIYRNVITGSIDVIGANKGAAAYSVWIHDNIIGQPYLQAKQSVRGVLLEYINSDVIIEHNTIHHVAQPIFVNSSYSGYYASYSVMSDITIRYNIITEVGAATGQPTSGWGVYFGEEVGGATITNWKVYNNVIRATSSGAGTGWGISLPDCGEATNVIISNNIVENFDGAPVRANNWGGGSTEIINLYIQSNFFYGNGNSNAPYFVAGVTHNSDTIDNNLTTEPPFLSSSDFHFTEEVLGTYITSGLTDMDDNAVSNPPNRGAYEYGGSPNIPVTAVTVTGAGGATTIILNGGTLQMSAHIDPHDATDQTVVWSVTNGTGRASIDQTGLLQAIRNGTVIVKATSNG